MSTPARLPGEVPIDGMPDAGNLADRIAAAEAPRLAHIQAPRKIDVTNDAEAPRALRRALVAGAIPDLFARRGELVRVTEVAGLGVGELPYVSARTLDPYSLRRLLGRHAYVYAWKKSGRTKDAPMIEVETVPTVAQCLDLLSETEWDGVRPLRGVSLVPILRPDGHLVQARGYDEPTGLYYAPQLDVEPIPARPSEADVDAAREFVLETVLGDFPFVDKSDKANYLALLITPILRPYLRGALSPLGAITAASAGTGKTLLAGDIPQALYGITSRPWVGDEGEVRKSISTVLMSSTKPVVLFDNVPEGETVKSPMLSKLLTSQQWDDRELGSNNAVEAYNDRLWLATGNAMAFGGDLPSRTVLVRLNANTARPDLRHDFKIPDLQAWLTDPDNAAELLRALLVLVMDWVGADRGEARPYAMRQFGRWATACGDFLAHHGVPLFLENMSALDESDEETATWLPFLDEWRKQFGGAWMTAVEVARSSTPEMGYDRWNGRFLVDGRGERRNVVSLGRQLQAHRDRVFGSDVDGLVVQVAAKLGRDNVRRYRVITAPEARGEVEVPEAAEVEPVASEPAAPVQRTPVGLWDDERAADD